MEVNVNMQPVGCDQWQDRLLQIFPAWLIWKSSVVNLDVSNEFYFLTSLVVSKYFVFKFCININFGWMNILRLGADSKMLSKSNVQNTYLYISAAGVESLLLFYFSDDMEMTCFLTIYILHVARIITFAILQFMSDAALEVTRCIVTVAKKFKIWLSKLYFKYDYSITTNPV